MSTTIMRNSKIGDAWIKQAVALNPIAKHLDPTTGQFTGNFLTGPVRVMFPYVFKKRPGKNSDGTPNEGKFECSILFTPGVDFTLLYEEYYAVCARDWQSHYDAGSNQYYGLESPFHDQAHKFKYAGYTPGCVYMNLKTQFKPSVCDASFNPIVDESRVYPGVWAIALINAYSFGKNQPKKGVGFGLQSLMVIADDENCGGGGPMDAKKAFQGTNVQPPAVNPAAAFGAPPQGQPGNPNAGFITPPGAPRPGGMPPAPPAPPAGGYAATAACWMCGQPAPVGGVCPSCGNAQ